MYKHRLNRYDWCAGVIIALGTLLRFVLIALGWPASYNDEGTVGLMALHIAYQGAHPLLYYGQDYMGSLEAYLGAGFFHLFGPSTFALRLGLLLLFALFLICMYLLTTLLYAKPLALISLVFLALGSPEVIFRQLMAAGGPPDYFFFTAFLLLLTAWLALTANPLRREHEVDSLVSSEKRTRPLPWSRLIAYGAWGGIAGLDMWSHLLCIPFVVSAGFLLVLFCRKELHLATLSLLGLCLLIGLSPLLIYKATVPVSPYENSLFAGVFGGGYREPSYPSLNHLPGTQASVAPKPILPRPGLQVAGTLLVSIPVATNGTALCPLPSGDAWPLTDRASTYTRFCTVVHGAWGIGFVVLWFIATVGAVKGLRRYWQSATEPKYSSEQRRQSIRQAGRLMILMGAGLTLLAFMLYPQASAVTPWNSARYLVGLLIATPAVLFPLWEKRNVVKPLRNWVAYLKTGAHYGLLLLIFVTGLLGPINLFTAQVAQAKVNEQEQQALIGRLLQMGATHIYTDYDDCNRIAFLSNERIICAVLDNGLQPGLDRYFPYRAMVAKAPNPFYVFVDGSAQAFLFEQKATEQHIKYERFGVNEYVVYEPDQRIMT